MGMRVNMTVMKSNYLGPGVIMRNLNRVCFELHLYLQRETKRIDAVLPAPSAGIAHKDVFTSL